MSYITISQGVSGGFYSRGRSTNNFDGEEGNGGEGGKGFPQRGVVEDLEFGSAIVGLEEVVGRERKCPGGGGGGYSGRSSGDGIYDS